MTRFAWSQIIRCWRDVIFDIRVKRFMKKPRPTFDDVMPSKRSKVRVLFYKFLTEEVQ